MNLREKIKSNIYDAFVVDNDIDITCDTHTFVGVGEALNYTKKFVDIEETVDYILEGSIKSIGYENTYGDYVIILDIEVRHNRVIHLNTFNDKDKESLHYMYYRLGSEYLLTGKEYAELLLKDKLEKFLKE